MNYQTRRQIAAFHADAAARCQALADEAEAGHDEAAAEHWRQMVSMHRQNVKPVASGWAGIRAPRVTKR